MDPLKTVPETHEEGAGRKRAAHEAYLKQNGRAFSHAPEAHEESYGKMRAAHEARMERMQEDMSRMSGRTSVSAAFGALPEALRNLVPGAAEKAEALRRSGEKNALSFMDMLEQGGSAFERKPALDGFVPGPDGVLGEALRGALGQREAEGLAEVPPAARR